MSWISRLFRIRPKEGLCGAKPSPKDDRDFIKKVDLNTITEICGATEGMPYQFTLADKIGKILDQGNTNSCTGHAATYFMNILLDRTIGSIFDFNLSPFFNYYWAKYYSGFSPTSDNGAYLRGVMKGLSNKGCWNCSMKVTTQKPPEDFIYAKTFKLKGYEKIDQTSSYIVDELRYILSVERLPIMGCVRIIEDNIDPYDGIFKGDSLVGDRGWHAMTIVGYKKQSDGYYFHTANSWGRSYGDKGFVWIHEDYFKKSYLVNELWCPTKEYF